MPKIRVLVADDSPTVRERLAEVLESDPEIEVIGKAHDGLEAFNLCRELRPNVVTLDMMMPRMNGRDATQEIMAYCPTPILIVSSSVNRAELFKTYDALARGAVEVLEKPGIHDTDSEWEKKFISQVKLVSRIKVITHLRARVERYRGGTSPDFNFLPDVENPLPAGCIAMGVSTGGPAALVEIFRGIPPNFSLPIFLTIHIGKMFGDAFSEWLAGQCPLPVRYAEDQEPIPRPGKGVVLLAPPDRHLVVKDGKLHLTNDPERNFCRPSVDILFESVAREFGRRSIGCLLTGMGRDGAAGLLALRRAGGMTLAQDEATSVVFGMAREAILMGAARKVLPLNQIASVLVSLEARNECP